MRHQTRRQIERVAQVIVTGAIVTVGALVVAAAYTQEPEATGTARPVAERTERQVVPASPVLGSPVQIEYDRVRNTTYASVRLGSMILMESLDGELSPPFPTPDSSPSLAIYGASGGTAFFAIDRPDGTTTRIERASDSGLFSLDWNELGEMASGFRVEWACDADGGELDLAALREYLDLFE